MKIIGITGGIGSGKSLVCHILKEEYRGFIIDTDQIAKDQIKFGGISYKNVVNYFGEEILQDNHEINKRKLSDIIFNDRSKLQKLNDLTHPPVINKVKEIIVDIKSRKESKYQYILIETALAIESGLDKICDEVWYVHASMEVRRKRLKETRGMDDEQITGIFNSQSKEEDFRKRFHVVIENSEGVDELKIRIEKKVKESDKILTK